MFWPYIPYFKPTYPKQKKIWIKIRFIHETDKAILVYCDNKKIWISKSKIYKIRLKKYAFEIYIKERMVG